MQFTFIREILKWPFFALVRCKMVATVRLYLMLAKAFIVMRLWLERPHVLYAKKDDQKTDFGVTMIDVS